MFIGCYFYAHLAQKAWRHLCLVDDVFVVRTLPADKSYSVESLFVYTEPTWKIGQIFWLPMPNISFFIIPQRNDLPNTTVLVFMSDPPKGEFSSDQTSVVWNLSFDLMGLKGQFTTFTDNKRDGNRRGLQRFHKSSLRLTHSHSLRHPCVFMHEDSWFQLRVISVQRVYIQGGKGMENLQEVSGKFPENFHGKTLQIFRVVLPLT